MNLEYLAGDTAPLEELANRITKNGTKFDVHFGRVSPKTGNGQDSFTADFDPKNLSWQIYGPAGARAHRVYHELLHVELYDIHRADWLFHTALADANKQLAIREMNNDLDHSIVVRAEVNAYPEAADYWNSDFSRLFDRAMASHDRMNKRYNLLRGWMVLANSLPDASITVRFREQLKAIEAMDAADNLGAVVLTAGINKAAIFSAFCAAFSYPYFQDHDFVFCRH